MDCTMQLKSKHQNCRYEAAKAHPMHCHAIYKSYVRVRMHIACYLQDMTIDLWPIDI